MSTGIIIHGAAGHMGSEVARLISKGCRDCEVAAKVDINGGAGYLTSVREYGGDAAVIVDFSFHTAVGALLDCAIEKNLPVVIATTGHTDAEKALIRAAAEKIPVFYSANMSVGVALLCELAVKTASVFPDADIEIVETHHNRKVDAPSGTALMIAEALSSARGGASVVRGRDGASKRERGEIGISAVRRGDIVGIHEVYVSTETQTITLKHEAHSRSLFAEGAIAAAEFIKNKPAGLYGMQDMIGG